MIDFDTLIKEAPNEALVSYVSIYYTMKINKDLAIKWMMELDKRRAEGQEINYEDEIKAEILVQNLIIRYSLHLFYQDLILFKL